MKKNKDEAYELLEDMTTNNYFWPSKRLALPKNIVEIYEVDALTKLTTQVTILTQ